MSMFGALIGAAIARSDGDSGFKGAFVGGGLSKAASLIATLAATRG